MVAVILLDHNCVIHEVYVLAQLGKHDVEEIEEGARHNKLTAIIRSATDAESPTDIIAGITAINEAPTDEVMVVECGPTSERPKSGITHAVLIEPELLELDWEDLIVDARTD